VDQDEYQHLPGVRLAAAPMIAGGELDGGRLVDTAELGELVVAEPSAISANKSAAVSMLLSALWHWTA
jgi:hypothetical protein